MYWSTSSGTCRPDAITPLDNARILETREGLTTVDGTSAGTGRTAAASTTVVKVAGRAGVPVDAEAVVVNVAAVDPTAPGYVTVHGCVSPRPGTSSLNYVPGTTRANELIVSLDSKGRICLFTLSGVDLIVDVVGYVPTTTNYVQTVPARLLETRPGELTIDGRNEGEGLRPARSQYTLQVTGRNGIPGGALGVIANVTVVDPAGPGYVTVHPCQDPRPVVSSLNYPGSVTAPNEIIAALDDQGRLCLFTLEAAHLLVDITGYLAPAGNVDVFQTIGNTELRVDLAAVADVPAVRASTTGGQTVAADGVLDNDGMLGSPLSVTGVDTTAGQTSGTATLGEVEMNADGSFRYLPPPGVTDTSDFFDYLVSVDGGPALAVQVEIEILDLVTYVDNSAATPGNGTSSKPFDTLPASDADADIVFVRTGDGTSGGLDSGIALKKDQLLIGEGVALDVDPGVTLNGLTPPVRLLPAGARPLLSDGSASVPAVELAPRTGLSGVNIAATQRGGIVSSGDSGPIVVEHVGIDLSGPAVGVDITGGTGRFTFADLDITSGASGAAFEISGGSSDVRLRSSAIDQTGSGAAVDISGHTGAFSVSPASSITVTNGTGLRFDDADGTYPFNGTVVLNGGDAGIDILNGSAGAFTFADTTITNPSGSAVSIERLEAGAAVTYHGSITSNVASIVRINQAASESTIEFTPAASNTLASTGSPLPAIDLFEVDGDLTIATPMTVTDPSFSPLFATNGSGNWSFIDLTIVDLTDLNAGVDLFGNTGTVEFTNLNISTDTAGTNRGVVGFLAGGNNVVEVNGSSSIDADGGPALSLVNNASIDMTFTNLTSTNATLSQVGPSGNDGISLLGVGSGSLDVTGAVTVMNAARSGIVIENTGADVTFASVAIDSVVDWGLIAGVAIDNPGSITINGGTISNTGSHGLRIGGASNGAALVDVDNVTFSSIGGSVVSTSNSGLAGSGNIAAPFSCIDGGGNTGSISFNGGADTCP